MTSLVITQKLKNRELAFRSNCRFMACACGASVRPMLVGKLDALIMSAERAHRYGQLSSPSMK